MSENIKKEPTPVEEDSPPTERGTGFLLWGLISVTVLNVGMIFGALTIFAP